MGWVLPRSSGKNHQEELRAGRRSLAARHARSRRPQRPPPRPRPAAPFPRASRWGVSPVRWVARFARSWGPASWHTGESRDSCHRRAQQAGTGCNVGGAGVGCLASERAWRAARSEASGAQLLLVVSF